MDDGQKYQIEQIIKETPLQEIHIDSIEKLFALQMEVAELKIKGDYNKKFAQIIDSIKQFKFIFSMLGAVSLIVLGVLIKQLFEIAPK